MNGNQTEITQANTGSALKGHELEDSVQFLHRLIEAQKTMHRALAGADAEAIGSAAREMEAILHSGRDIQVSKLLPEQAKARLEARVLVSTVLEWQEQNRELGRHNLRLLRRLCGMQANPSYDASGQFDAVAIPIVGICA